MKVLVTGASGRLGSVVCRELVRLGHDVLGTDQRFAPGLGVPLRVADLRDVHAPYPLLEGCEAVVHLGNLSNLGAGPSPQVVLADNVSMNANVFRAAVDLGVGRIVFASSLQVMIRLDEGRAPDAPLTIPYFPLDGAAPANPGHNFYGLSKEFGERMLRLFCERDPRLTCTSLRFPMIAAEWFHKRLAEPLPVSGVNWSEALCYLEFPDAARLIGLVLERQTPGYHQYFPAQALSVSGLSPGRVARELFPQVPLRVPADALLSLVDHRTLEAELGFVPSPPLVLQLRG